MESSWYMLYIRPANKKVQPTNWPLVSRHVVYRVQADDKKNPYWDKFQDDARPAWAPDFLRQGYAVVFKREGLPKLAVKLGIKNPEKLKREGKDASKPGPGGKRVLTFDDVFAMGVVPTRMPMYSPDVKLKPEQWWLSTKSSNSPVASYLAPGGATVATGAQRLADIVVQMLRTPNGYPRQVPHEEADYDYSEFTNPLVPVLPKGPIETSEADGAGAGGTDMGFAGLQLFRGY